MSRAKADIVQIVRVVSRTLPVLLVVLLLGPTLVDCGATAGELVCEDAVAHVTSCCPSLSASAFECPHYGGGCEDLRATLSTTESRCLRALDCETLVAHDLCARIATRLAGGDAGSEVRVCE